MSELTRYPTWLRGALGLRDPDLPRFMESDAGVIPVVDLLSANIRDSEARRFAGSNTVNGPAGATDMSLLGDGQYALSSGNLAAIYSSEFGAIGYCSIEQVGGAAVTFNVRMWYKPPTSTPDYAYLAVGLNLGAGGRMTHSQITGTPRPIVLPPNSVLHFDYSGVAAAASVTTKWCGVSVPAGMFRDLF